MGKLFNIKTGLLEDVENPEDAFLSGTHGLKEVESVNLYDPQGKDVFKIPATEVQSRLQAGYRFETEEEELARKFRNDPSNKGILGAGKKFFKELADEALTLGASEALLDAYQDPSSPAAIKRKVEEESHPIANIAGGLTGGIISLAYGGPLWKGVGWAGSKAAQGALKIASLAGEKAAVQAVGKVAAKAAQFGVEGALGVAPRAVGEAAGEIAKIQGRLSERDLGDSETVAEALLGLGEDLAEGAILGAGLGVAGKAVGSAVGAAGKYAGKVINKNNLTRWGNTFYLKGKGFTTMTERKQVQRAAQISKLGDIDDAVELFNRFEIENAGLFGEGALNNITKAQKAKDLLGRTLGRIYKVADKEFGEAIGLGKFIRTVDEELSVLAARGAKDGSDYEALRDIQGVAFNYIRDLAKKPNMKEGQIREVMDSIAVNFTTAGKLKQSMSELGRQALKYDQNVPGHITGKRIWRDEIENALAHASTKTAKGGKLVPLLKKVNSQYGFFRNLIGKTPDENVFQKISARLEGNNFLSLRDTLLGGAGAIAGGAVTGAASILGSQAMRKFGPQFTARMLFGMAKGVDEVGERLYSSIDRALGVTAKVGGRPTSRAVVPLTTNLLQRYTGERDRQKAFLKVQNDLTRLQSDPAVQTEAIEALTGPLTESAPEVAQQIGMKISQATNYLVDQIPRGSSVPNPLNPKVYQPSDRELAAFERKLAVVLDPLSVFDELDAGTVTKEQMDALRQVFPKLYDVAQRRVVEKLANVSNPIPYAKRLKLAQMIDLPSGNRDPKKVAQFQSNFQTKAMPKAPVGRNRMKFDAIAQTDIDRVLYQ